MPAPLVSVVMINHNGLPWLEEAMQSVLSCQEPPIELVIVDDASSDESRKCIGKTASHDSRVHPVFLKENRGISGARNAGVEAARGYYISIIDSDDKFMPDTVERQMAAFQRLETKCPGLSLLTSDAWLINEQGRRCGRYISPEWWGREEVGNVPTWTLPSTFFFRRLEFAGFFPPYRSADGPIFLRRMEKRGPVGFCGEPLIEYRLRMKSVTSRLGEDMLRELRATEASRRAGRLDNPILPGDLPPPKASDVAAWVHGRNAKNAAANGNYFMAAYETLLAGLASPKLTVHKVLRGLFSRAMAR